MSVLRVRMYLRYGLWRVCDLHVAINRFHLEPHLSRSVKKPKKQRPVRYLEGCKDRWLYGMFYHFISSIPSVNLSNQICTIDNNNMYYDDLLFLSLVCISGKCVHPIRNQNHVCTINDSDVTIYRD